MPTHPLPLPIIAICNAKDLAWLLLHGDRQNMKKVTLDDWVFSEKRLALPNKRQPMGELHNVFCYGWYRFPLYLYIGRTAQGLYRLFNHHVINKVESVQPEDEYHFWYCTVEELSRLEWELIKRHRPIYQLEEGMKKRGLTKVRYGKTKHVVPDTTIRKRGLLKGSIFKDFMFE